MSKRGRNRRDIEEKMLFYLSVRASVNVSVFEFRSAFLAIIDFVNLFLNSQFFSHTNVCSTQPEST